MDTQEQIKVKTKIGLLVKMTFLNIWTKWTVNNLFTSRNSINDDYYIGWGGGGGGIGGEGGGDDYVDEDENEEKEDYDDDNDDDNFMMMMMMMMMVIEAKGRWRCSVAWQRQ